MFWLAGRFSPKVPVSTTADQPEVSRVEGTVIPVQVISLPLVESAVGTIRAVHEIAIGSKLLARVVEVNLKAGQEVKAGEVLVRLDDTDLRAKLAAGQGGRDLRRSRPRPGSRRRDSEAQR